MGSKTKTNMHSRTTIAPSFMASAFNTSTKKVSSVELSSFKGSYVVLLFYTGDFATTLLAEVITFQEALKVLKDEVHLLAISTDTVESHKAFGEHAMEKGGMEGQHCVLMVEDKTGNISKEYQVYDAACHEAFPAYIIIDKEGEVAATIINDKKIGGNPHEVMRIISAYKQCDEENAWNN